MSMSTIKNYILGIAFITALNASAQQPVKPAAKPQPKPAQKPAVKSQKKVTPPQTQKFKIGKPTGKITPIYTKKLMKEGDTIRTVTGLKIIFKKN